MNAVIFDMNGVIIDDMPFHKPAWQEFAQTLGRQIEDEEFNTVLNGRTNRETLEYLLQRPISESESKKLEFEKEEIYRARYLPYRALLPGLKEFLEELKSKSIPCAVATSAPTENVEFILDGLDIRRFFSRVVDASQISKGKPDPEIYLKAAARLEIAPEECIVFEDSLHGISAARSAGMKVIGLTTTHTSKELTGTVRNIADFSGMTLKGLSEIAAFREN